MNDVRLYYGETKYHYKWSYNLCVQKYEHGIVHGQTFFFSFLGTPKVEYAAMVMVRRITAHQQRTHMHNRMTFHCIACLFLLFFVRAIF